MPEKGRTKVKTAHTDTFCADHMPPKELLPVTDWTGSPELSYPDRLNCASELLLGMIEGGKGDRIALRFPGGTWTYQHLYETANRIAHVLVDDLDVKPGNRVLLRGPNNAMMAACWFAILKAGGVVVCTMPLLRERELRYIADKAEIKLALTDTRFGDECEAAFFLHADGSKREGARVIHYNSDAHYSL